MDVIAIWHLFHNISAEMLLLSPLNHLPITEPCLSFPSGPELLTEPHCSPVILQSLRFSGQVWDQHAALIIVSSITLMTNLWLGLHLDRAKQMGNDDRVQIHRLVWSHGGACVGLERYSY